MQDPGYKEAVVTSLPQLEYLDDEPLSGIAGSFKFSLFPPGSFLLTKATLFFPTATTRSADSGGEEDSNEEDMKFLDDVTSELEAIWFARGHSLTV